MADRTQWSDINVSDNTVTQPSSRATAVQVVPNPDKQYKIRIRATNNQSLTVPIAKIVSATKTGTTTATVVTDVPHNLTTSDFIQIYGSRDQTNFINLGAATAVASVIDAVTFTVVWGPAVTATAFGGSVSRVNGGQVLQGLVTNGNVQSISRTNNVVSLVTLTAVSGLSIGDYIDVYGARSAVDGSDVGLDGAYRVRDIQTTTVFLDPIGNTPTGTDVVSTNCGGILIRRTVLRISYLRVFDFERDRVELLARPSGDVTSAAPVAVQNAIAQSGTWTVNIGSNQSVIAVGSAAEDAAGTANPVIIGGVVRTATSPVTLASGDAVRNTMTSGAALVVRPYSVSEAGWNASLALTTTTATVIQAAAGAGLKRNITALQAINTGAAVTDLIILDGTTERWRLSLPVNIPVTIAFPTELLSTANTALNANLSVAGTVRANFQGYTSP